MKEKAIKKGFTLIEIILSIMLLGIIIMFVLAPMANLFKSNIKSGDNLKVLNTAQQYLEKIRGQLIQNTDAFDANTYDPPPSTLAVSCAELDASLNIYKDPCGTTVSNPPAFAKRLILKTSAGDTLFTLDVQRP